MITSLMKAGQVKLSKEEYATGITLDDKINEMLDNLEYPVLASIKYDGIRCATSSKRTFSKSLKEIPNKELQVLLPTIGTPSGYYVDGELIEGNYQSTFSAVMTKNASLTGNICYMLYDIFKENNEECLEDYYGAFASSFYRGQKVIDEIVSKNQNTKGIKIVKVKQVSCNNKEDVLNFEKEAIAKGEEGIMLRNPLKPYKFGRVTLKEQTLLKIKRFVQEEAIIVGFKEQQHNSNEAFMNEEYKTERSTAKDGLIGKDTLGALIVRSLEDEKIFSVGSGFSAKLAKEIWENKSKYIEKIITFKYLACGVKELPRHPIFLGFRDKIDL